VPAAINKGSKIVLFEATELCRRFSMRRAAVLIQAVITAALLHQKKSFKNWIQMAFFHTIMDIAPSVKSGHSKENSKRPDLLLVFF
jgi:hypothetical protein